MRCRRHDRSRSGAAATGLALILIGHMGAAAPAPAQELEPRLLSNAPTGTNFAILGYAFSSGNTLLDPAVPIDDLDSNLHTLVAAYVRSFGLAGMNSKVDVVLPFAFGDWNAVFEGQDTTRSIDGMGDPRVRLSVGFAGAPALDWGSFADYRQGTLAGLSVQAIVPLGQYDPDRLINLSSNRWTFRTLVGLSQAMERWVIELYGGAWFFTRNNDFFGGETLDQKPLYTAKTHIIYLFPRGRWLALDVGYGVGGRTTISGDERDTRISTFRFGATLAWPIGLGHTLKFVAATAVRVERGPDFDLFGATYQRMWGGR